MVRVRYEFTRIMLLFSQNLIKTTSDRGLRRTLTGAFPAAMTSPQLRSRKECALTTDVGAE